MTRIISVDDLAALMDLGKKPDYDKLNPIIDQAQDVELRDYLGKHFYFDVLSNVNNPAYQTLMNGSTFSYDGVTYIHEGIKSMLLSLVYARFALAVNSNITPFGATVKLSPDSEPTSHAALKDVAHQNREAAASKWEIIKLFLELNASEFPNYNYKADTVRTGERKLKFWRI